MSTTKAKLCVLISGNGSNLQAMIDAFAVSLSEVLIFYFSITVRLFVGFKGFYDNIAIRVNADIAGDFH